MDLSKLPKLGETHKHSPPPPAPDEIQPPPHARAELSAGPEVFINAVIGLILIYMGWPIFDYLIHVATGRPFGYPVTDASGNPMSYPTTVFFWMNTGVALFGIALIVYAFFGRSSNRMISGIALMLLGASAAISAYATLASLSVIGLQLLPALCAAFAIYLGMYQFSRFRSLRSA